MSARHGGDRDDELAAGGLRAWFEARLADVEAERDQLRAELALAREHIRAQDEVDRILASSLPPAADGSTGPMARVPGPRSGSRAARCVPREARWLRVVPVILALAGALRAAVRNAWAVHHPVMTAAAVTAGGAVAVTITANMAPVPYTTPAPPPAAALASAAPVDADLIILPSPSYQPRHAGASPDATKAARIRLRTPAASAVSPSPSPPLPSPPASAAGKLNLQTMQLALSSSVPGQIVFSAAGGPVSWSAWSSDPAVSVADSSGASSGTLAAGMPEILYVTVAAGTLAGSAVITLADDTGNAVKVPVIWAAGIPLGL